VNEGTTEQLAAKQGATEQLSAVNAPPPAVVSRLSSRLRGRLWRTPTLVGLAFAVLAVLVAIDWLHEMFAFLGSHYIQFVDSTLFDVAAAGAGVLMIVRGVGDRLERGWLLFGVGTLIWVCGDLLFDFGLNSNPAVTPADALYLAWYPLAAVGLVMLVRSRLSGFDFARWVDGISLALVVATPAVAIALQPAIEQSHLNALDHAVLIAYPAGDVLLLGAAVGIIGLAGWRPGRMWYVLAAGLALWVVGDAIYAITEFDKVYRAGQYDYLWTAGLLLMAAAAWQPRVVRKLEKPYGWRALALPIAAQLCAFGTQVWGLVADVGESERIMTMAVLLVVIVQLYVGRPRGERTATQVGEAAPEHAVPSATKPTSRARTHGAGDRSGRIVGPPP
jgi:hypothetical protein